MENDTFKKSCEEVMNELFGSDSGDDGVQFPVVQATTPTAPVLTAPVPSPKGEPAKRFEEFHHRNPHVYRAIVKIALDLKRRGFEKGSIRLIFNRLRWLYAIQTSGDEYRLNNNFSGFYSRVVMLKVPELDGFFDTRDRVGSIPYEPDLNSLFPSP